MLSRARRSSPLAIVILALLEESPMHAYRMQQLIKERGKDTVVNVAQRNSVYQTLARLLRDGWIRVEETSREERRPERVIYATTKVGSELLHSSLRSMLSTPAREFPEFPAALAFLMMLAPNDVLRELELRASALEAKQAQIKAGMADARAMGLPRLFVVEDEYRAAMTRAELSWVRALMKDIESKELTWSKKWIREVAAAMARGKK
jgi:DNA-binding PadR family transcriptional regulator